MIEIPALIIIAVIVAMMIGYVIIGYCAALFVFGPKWNEAHGSPVMCGAIWPVLLIGILCMSLFDWLREPHNG